MGLQGVGLMNLNGLKCVQQHKSVIKRHAGEKPSQGQELYFFFNFLGVDSARGRIIGRK